MKAKVKVLFMLLLGAVLLFAPAPSLAQYEVGADFLGVNPNAPGTKLFGTLTISYAYSQCNVPCSELNPCEGDPPKHPGCVDILPIPECDSGSAADAILTRVEKGNAIKAFSGKFSQYSAERFCWDHVSPHKAPIVNFIQQKVIPGFFPSAPSPPFDVKAADKFVTSFEDPVTVPRFVMIDFTLAVHD